MGRSHTKKLIGILAALALVLTTGSIGQAKGWVFEHEWNPRQNVYQITEGYSYGRPSALTVYEMVSNSRSEIYAHCTQLEDEYCTASNIMGSGNSRVGKYVRGEFVAGLCASSSDSFCIESVRIYKNKQRPMAATLVRPLSFPEIPANTKFATPAGKSPTIWNAQDVPHLGGGTQYSVYVMVEYMSGGGGFSPLTFTAIVSPFTEIQGSQYWDPSEIRPATPTVQSPALNHRSDAMRNECVWQELGKCGQVEEFTDGTRVGLTLRIPSALGGFFNGRLQNPELSVKAFNAKTNRVSIDAESVEIGKIVYALDKDSEIAKSVGVTQTGRLNKSSYGSVTIPDVEKLRKHAGDRAAGVSTSWRASIDYGEGQWHPCFDRPGQLLGLVTTNASTYEGGPPKMKSGFLTYNVAGMHYEPDGQTEILGTYDLVLRSDVARCLYGFGKAPLSATVTVSGGNSKEVATTVVSEKNGWLKMAAYGFTFSKKTIKVKITKKKTK
jgi:hypothetical protein